MNERSSLNIRKTNLIKLQILCAMVGQSYDEYLKSILDEQLKKHQLYAKACQRIENELGDDSDENS